MKRTILSLAAAALLCVSALGGPMAAAEEAAAGYIDNSDLVPKYVEDDQVVLEDSGGGLMSPDWVKSLIIAEITIARCTEEGTFEAAVEVLDHYQEMGVNGLWVTPIFDTDQGTGGHYGNFGPHTVDPTLTGKDSYEESWQVVKQFVDECHKRNIRVFSDIITWGVTYAAPLYTEHPDWFNGESYWGGYAFDWNNQEMIDWFQEQCLYLLTDIGFDGLRCDCEPGTTGYGIFREVREMALEAGEKVCIFSENTNERLQPAYDFDEHSSESHTWENIELYMETYNIVESVKNGYGLGTQFQELLDESGKARFYSFNVSCHDQAYRVNGDLVKFGYQALLAPFIPIFFMGDEFNNIQEGNSTVFLTHLRLELLDQPENRDFYERVKALIRIRRQYPEIFEYYPQNHRESNICEVEAVGLETLTGYARYMDGKGILVVPNNNVQDPDSPFTIRVPYAEMEMEDNTAYRVTNLLTGEEVATGNRETLYDFQAKVAYSDVAVFLVEAVGEKLGEKAPDYNTMAADENEAAVSASAEDGQSEESTGEAGADIDTVNQDAADDEVQAADAAAPEAAANDAAEQAAEQPDTGVASHTLPVVGAVAAALCMGCGAFWWIRRKKRA